MWEKIKSLFSAPPTSSSLQYIKWYAAFVILSASVYLLMLIVDWVCTGKPDFNAMKDFLTLVLSGSAVTVITFTATWLVDANNDDIPDTLEEGVTNDDAGAEVEETNSTRSSVK